MAATGTLESARLDDLDLQPSELYRIVRVGGMGNPVPRQVTFARAERHGAADYTRFYEGRVLELGGLILADTDLELWEALDALKAKLALGTDRIFTFRRRGMDADERVTVRVASPLDFELTPESPVIRWAVSLFAGDPRLYGAALRSSEYDPTLALSGGGVTFPLTFPLTFSSSSVSALELTNGGNFPTPPVLTIEGPVINPTVDNDTTGESLRIVYSLGASDTVEVDVGARTVKLNGALRADLFDASESTWWELDRGTNRVRLRGSGMAEDQTLLSVAYRDARI